MRRFNVTQLLSDLNEVIPSRIDSYTTDELDIGFVIYIRDWRDMQFFTIYTSRGWIRCCGNLNENTVSYILQFALEHPCRVTTQESDIPKAPEPNKSTSDPDALPF